MYCPTCGADVPEMKYCQNCGSPLFVGTAQGAPGAWEQPADATPHGSQDGEAGQDRGVAQAPGSDWQPSASQPPSESQAPYAGQSPYASQAPFSAQGQYAGQTPHASVAPSTAFVLAIVGLVFGLLGFSLVTIIPGIICCIIGLVLNSRYNKAGQYNPHKTATTVMSVIGLVAGALSLAFFVSVGAASVWYINEHGDELDDVDIEEMIEGFDNEERQATGAASGSASDASAGGILGVDSRTFDKRGNVTLYALTELAGDELVEALRARGYVWEESAQAWMASNGAVFEVQDDGGMMPKDAIERLGVGGVDDSVAFAALAVGYDTPAAALDALSSDVEIKDTCADEEGAIVFAIVRGSDGDDRLVSVSETGKKQHMVFAFTEDAIESGLFAEITGVTRGKTIEGVWKALKAA